MTSDRKQLYLISLHNGSIKLQNIKYLFVSVGLWYQNSVPYNCQKRFRSINWTNRILQIIRWRQRWRKTERTRWLEPYLKKYGKQRMKKWEQNSFSKKHKKSRKPHTCVTVGYTKSAVLQKQSCKHRNCNSEVLSTWICFECFTLVWTRVANTKQQFHNDLNLEMLFPVEESPRHFPIISVQI